MKTEMKRSGQKIGLSAKIMMGLTLFLEFFHYVAVAFIIGLAALSATMFFGAVPISLMVFGTVVASLTFVALVRTVLAVVTVNKTTDFTQNYSENLTRDVVEMTVDAMNSKARSTQTAEVATQTSAVSRSTRRDSKFFSPVVKVEEEKSKGQIFCMHV